MRSFVTLQVSLGTDRWFDGDTSVSISLAELREKVLKIYGECVDSLRKFPPRNQECRIVISRVDKGDVCTVLLIQWCARGYMIQRRPRLQAGEGVDQSSSGGSGGEQGGLRLKDSLLYGQNKMSPS